MLHRQNEEFFLNVLLRGIYERKLEIGVKKYMDAEKYDILWVIERNRIFYSKFVFEEVLSVYSTRKGIEEGVKSSLERKNLTMGAFLHHVKKDDCHVYQKENQIKYLFYTLNKFYNS